ncbi:oxalate--CoA ligase [Malassezia sp. CBS 17886]|nr:oxalate--CoA ligase [Malassezia sp. CBS 17886]
MGHVTPCRGPRVGDAQTTTRVGDMVASLVRHCVREVAMDGDEGTDVQRLFAFAAAFAATDTPRGVVDAAYCAFLWRLLTILERGRSGGGAPPPPVRRLPPGEQTRPLHELERRYGADLRVAVDARVVRRLLTGTDAEHGTTVVQLGTDTQYDQKTVFYLVKALVEKDLAPEMGHVSNYVVAKRYLEANPQWRAQRGDAEKGAGAGEGGQEREERAERGGAAERGEGVSGAVDVRATDVGQPAWVDVDKVGDGVGDGAEVGEGEGAGEGRRKDGPGCRPGTPQTEPQAAPPSSPLHEAEMLAFPPLSHEQSAVWLHSRQDLLSTRLLLLLEASTGCMTPRRWLAQRLGVRLRRTLKRAFIAFLHRHVSAGHIERVRVQLASTTPPYVRATERGRAARLCLDTRARRAVDRAACAAALARARWTLVRERTLERQLLDYVHCCGRDGCTLQDLAAHVHASADVKRMIESILARQQPSGPPPYAPLDICAPFEQEGRERRIRYYTYAAFVRRCATFGVDVAEALGGGAPGGTVGELQARAPEEGGRQVLSPAAPSAGPSPLPPLPELQAPSATSLAVAAAQLLVREIGFFRNVPGPVPLARSVARGAYVAPVDPATGLAKRGRPRKDAPSARAAATHTAADARRKREADVDAPRKRGRPRTQEGALDAGAGALAGGAPTPAGAAHLPTRAVRLSAGASPPPPAAPPAPPPSWATYHPLRGGPGGGDAAWDGPRERDVARHGSPVRAGSPAAGPIPSPPRPSPSPAPPPVPRANLTMFQRSTLLRRVVESAGGVLDELDVPRRVREMGGEGGEQDPSDTAVRVGKQEEDDGTHPRDAASGAQPPAGFLSDRATRTKVIRHAVQRGLLRSVKVQRVAGAPGLEAHRQRTVLHLPSLEDAPLQEALRAVVAGRDSARGGAAAVTSVAAEHAGLAAPRVARTAPWATRTRIVPGAPDDPLRDAGTRHAFARLSPLVRQFYGFPHGPGARLRLFHETLCAAAGAARTLPLAWFWTQCPLATFAALVPVPLTSPLAVRAVTHPATAALSVERVPESAAVPLGLRRLHRAPVYSWDTYPALSVVRDAPVATLADAAAYWDDVEARTTFSLRRAQKHFLRRYLPRQTDTSFPPPQLVQQLAHACFAHTDAVDAFLRTHAQRAARTPSTADVLSAKVSARRAQREAEWDAALAAARAHGAADARTERALQQEHRRYVWGRDSLTRDALDARLRVLHGARRRAPTRDVRTVRRRVRRPVVWTPAMMDVLRDVYVVLHARQTRWNVQQWGRADARPVDWSAALQLWGGTEAGEEGGGGGEAKRPEGDGAGTSGEGPEEAAGGQHERGVDAGRPGAAGRGAEQRPDRDRSRDTMPGHPAGEPARPHSPRASPAPTLPDPPHPPPAPQYRTRLRQLATSPGDQLYLALLERAWTPLWDAARTSGDLADPGFPDPAAVDLRAHVLYLRAHIDKRALLAAHADATRRTRLPRTLTRAYVAQWEPLVHTAPALPGEAAPLVHRLHALRVRPFTLRGGGSGEGFHSGETGHPAETALAAQGPVPPAPPRGGVYAAVVRTLAASGAARGRGDGAQEGTERTPAEAAWCMRIGASAVDAALTRLLARRIVRFPGERSERAGAAPLVFADEYHRAMQEPLALRTMHESAAAAAYTLDAVREGVVFAEPRASDGETAAWINLLDAARVVPQLDLEPLHALRRRTQLNSRTLDDVETECVVGLHAPGERGGRVAGCSPAVAEPRETAASGKSVAALPDAAAPGGPIAALLEAAGPDGMRVEALLDALAGPHHPPPTAHAALTAALAHGDAVSVGYDAARVVARAHSDAWTVPCMHTDTRMFPRIWRAPDGALRRDVWARSVALAVAWAMARPGLLLAHLCAHLDGGMDRMEVVDVVRAAVRAGQLRVCVAGGGWGEEDQGGNGSGKQGLEVLCGAWTDADIAVEVDASYNPYVSGLDGELVRAEGGHADMGSRAL